MQNDINIPIMHFPEENTKQQGNTDPLVSKTTVPLQLPDLKGMREELLAKEKKAAVVNLFHRYILGWYWKYFTKPKKKELSFTLRGEAAETTPLELPPVPQKSPYPSKN